MIRFAYHWLYKPKDLGGFSVIDVESELDFYKLLDQWNKSANGIWVYHSADYSEAHKEVKI